MGGHQGLLWFRDNFSKSFQAIKIYIKQVKLHLNEDGEWWSSGVAYCPYKIFGFIYCSIYRIKNPFPGPFGNLKESPCSLPLALHCNSEMFSLMIVVGFYLFDDGVMQTI